MLLVDPVALAAEPFEARAHARGLSEIGDWTGNGVSKVGGYRDGAVGLLLCATLAIPVAWWAAKALFGDLAVITKAVNGITYRTDAANNTPATAAPRRRASPPRSAG